MTGTEAHPPLAEGEHVQAEFTPDRATYWRDHALLAAVAMAGGMGVLWAIANPYPWTGAVGGLAAIALRAWYLSDDELGLRWVLTERRLLGPGGRVVRLSQISKIRTLGSAVQVVTIGGDKHLLKYQRDRDGTKARLQRAMAGGHV